jgi:DNA-directed RNA polymerase subunit RPC12/RpoP
MARPHTQFDLVRLELNPGLHGAMCMSCKYLFDAYDTPAPLDDVLMRMKTLRCPSCGKRKHLHLLMPWKYREMVAAEIEAEAKREAVRTVADKYVPRYETGG